MQDEYKSFLREMALEYFLKYVKINSRSDPDSNTYPSTSEQLEIGRKIADDMTLMGLSNVNQDESGYVYATLPASEGVKSTLTFLAHMDTSPLEPGSDVKPRIIQKYQGEDIIFPDDDELTLTPVECPELLKFLGEDIITASGTTLLGADDKAGIAAILAACALFQRDISLKHPELRIAFTPDEEIGRGTDKINLKILSEFAYTIDGGEMGELEAECFDAWSVKITFKGRNVHPGSAKNIMVNAAAIACRFLSEIPEWETPERTEKREGFYHLTDMKGNENQAFLSLIIRDFNLAANKKRIQFLQNMKEVYELKYPGLAVDIDASHSYQNMFNILREHPEVVEKAATAIRSAGIELISSAVRGGTDGARLCYMGVLTPNIFSGGLMYHSKKEWIPVIALQKSAEVIVKLSALYADD